MSLKRCRNSISNNMEYPKAFVLILSYNGLRWLKGCLPTVLDMDYPNFEVVVIDNGSTDGTAAALHEAFPAVTVISLMPNRGYAGGFDAGLEFAAENGADYFLVMNNDTEIDKHALTALVEVARSMDKAGFVTGKVYFHDRRNVFQSVGKKDDPIQGSGDYIGYGEHDDGQYDEVMERAFVDDVYTLVNRRLYDEVGGYDPQFYLQCEEFDWQLRAKKAGWRIYYTPQAKLWHYGSVTTGGVGGAINNFFLERSRIIALAKNTSVFRVLRYLAWSGTQALYRLAGSIVHVNPQTFKPRLARLIGIFSGMFWMIHHKPATAVPGVIKRLSQ
jgi:GT2 family glycosyltransferase